MKIAGIDIGANRAAWAVLEGEKNFQLVQVSSYGLEKEREKKIFSRHVRLKKISEMVREQIPWDAEIFIERAWLGKNPNTVMALSEMQGALQTTLWLNEKISLVPPSQWKKELFPRGNGNAGKTYISSYLQRNFPEYYERCQNQDEVDAVCLAIYGATVANSGAAA